ncbi:MAG: hypothetical protein P4N59_13815 [Negativicutes bacterium]|nr:hypothetical protein [Negativicutes bacterium]
MKKHVLWLLVLCMLVVGLVLGGLRLGSAQAAGANRVGLLVSYGNGTVKKQCISFSKSSISGLAVLQTSGLPLAVDYGSMGAEVCKIGKVGCPVKNCFCDSPPNFWAYWHLVNGQWTFAQLGASNYNVSDGAVEGWVWGTGQSNPPAQISFDQICAALPTSTTAPPTQVPGITSTKSPTKTPGPTKTPAPTQTPSQTLAPATEAPTSAQVLDQSAGTLEATQVLEQSTESSTVSDTAQPVLLPLVSPVETSPEDTLIPTAIAAIGTPVSTSLPATSSSPADQTIARGLAEVIGSKGWGSYLYLGLILAGLGIALFVVTRKK